jgi:hypothetical protein
MPQVYKPSHLSNPRRCSHGAACHAEAREDGCRRALTKSNARAPRPAFAALRRGRHSEAVTTFMRWLPVFSFYWEQITAVTVLVPVWPGAGPYPGSVLRMTILTLLPLMTGPDLVIELAAITLM